MVERARIGRAAGRVGRAGVILGLTIALGVLPSPVAGAAPTGPLPAAPVKRLGDWKVEPLAGGLWRVSWRSPKRLPVTSDRPTIVSAGVPVGIATVDDDGRTVSTVTSVAKAPDVAKLNVVLSGDRLDVPGRDQSGLQADTDAWERGRLLPFDPGTPGRFGVTVSDYQGKAVPTAGMESPVEFVGHVVEPKLDADAGQRPLVLFLHGRHEYCYRDASEGGIGEWPCPSGEKDVPSQLGYDYVQRVLASQGYTTVSIRANGINAQDDGLADGGADARAKLIRAHLDYWVSLAGKHHVDLSRVILIGHSRGGEGVARAALQIPLEAPYRVVGAVLLAPTDFSGQAVPYIPTVTVLPYCDGDVADLQGQFFTDAARDVVADDTALHSSVMVMGANHNFFNSEWTPGSKAPSFDDWWGEAGEACGTGDPTRLSAAQQRSVGTAYLAGAVQLFAGQVSEALPLFDGSRVRVASTGRAVVLSHAVGGGRELRRPSLDTGLTDGTAQTQFCVGRDKFDGSHSLCGRDVEGWTQTPHWAFSGEIQPERRALELSWDKAGEVGGLLLDRPLNLTGRQLQLRTIVDPTTPRVKLAVRLTDTAGKSADLQPVGGEDWAALPQGLELSRRWAQAVTVEPTGAAVDLTKIASIELVGRSKAGRVWVLDAAAVKPGLAALPEKRIPLVSLGEVEVPEGDGPGVSTARVPFTVQGRIAARSKLQVRVAREGKGVETVTVELAPGQTRGSVPVDFVGDRIPEPGGEEFSVTGWGSRGVMTDDYLGALRVTDDDPLPSFTVKAVKRTVKEGRKAAWRITLASTVPIPVSVGIEVVRGPAKVRPLNGDDVSRSWLRAHVYPASRKQPLYRQFVYLDAVIPAGRRSTTITVPIRKDHRKEGREQLTLAFSLGERTVTRTVYMKKS